VRDAGAEEEEEEGRLMYQCCGVLGFYFLFLITSCSKSLNFRN
jgi:hypothetical protein